MYFVLEKLIQRPVCTSVLSTRRYSKKSFTVIFVNRLKVNLLLDIFHAALLYAQISNTNLLHNVYIYCLLLLLFQSSSGSYELIQPVQYVWQLIICKLQILYISVRL
jgi:hypothetical protein